MQLKVLNCFLDNRFGGPQRRTSSVAEKLKEHNIETVFLFNERLKGNIPVKSFKSFLVRHTQCITRQSTVVNLLLFFFLSPFNLYKIYKIIKSEKINIVHVNGVTNILPALAAKLSGVKVVWHLNDTLTPWIIRKSFLPIVKLFSDKITIEGEKIGKYYFKDNNRFWTKSTILYTPVDLNKFTPELVDVQDREIIKTEFNIPADNLIIGAVGNINRAKGYEYFIESAKTIKNKINNVKFLIVGAKLNTQQNYWAKLQNLINKYGLHDEVLFTGFRKDIPEILSVLDVFVLSSITEACPNVVLEAMAMKVPVVATNVGAVSEQILHRQTGMLVTPRQPGAIAEAVLELLEMPESRIKSMTSTARQRAEKIFSIGGIVQQHRRLYQHLSDSR